MATVTKIISCRSILSNYAVCSRFTQYIPYSVSAAISGTQSQRLGKWPPGLRGAGNSRRAWHLHDEREKLKTIPNAKLRLEYLSGTQTEQQRKEVEHYPEDTVYMVHTNPYKMVPNRLEHHKYTTKTKVISDSLPMIYDTYDISHVIPILKPIVLNSMNSYRQISKLSGSNNKTSPNFRRHRVIGDLFKSIVSSLSLDNKHILRSQMDENCRWESMWKRGGYDVKGLKLGKTVYGAYEPGQILRFQMTHCCDWQIRAELPLPSFVSEDDDLVRSEQYDYIHSPGTMGEGVIDTRPTNLSGVFINDPCEFTSMSIHCMGNNFERFAELFPNYVSEHKSTAAMLTGFASCVAQAHMQGFNWLLDVTYPFTTQSVIFDGTNIRFCAYQLNTLDLWQNKYSESNKQNIAWISDDVPVFEKNDNGDIVDINDDAISMLAKCLLIETSDRGIDLRPYLPEHQSPRFTNKFINHVGEEYLEERKAERFEYPRNSTYFYSHIP